MKKIITILLFLNIIFLNPTNISAFQFAPNEQVNLLIEIGTGIGNWGSIYDDILSLDELSEDELNITIPENTMFIYQGFLYLTRPNSNYNPEYHGLPEGSSSPKWAVWSIELQWRPNSNYRINSIVIRNGRYFIANSNYNQD